SVDLTVRSAVRCAGCGYHGVPCGLLLPRGLASSNMGPEMYERSSQFRLRRCPNFVSMQQRLPCFRVVAETFAGSIIPCFGKPFHLAAAIRQAASLARSLVDGRRAIALQPLGAPAEILVGHCDAGAAAADSLFVSMRVASRRDRTRSILQVSERVSVMPEVHGSAPHLTVRSAQSSRCTSGWGGWVCGLWLFSYFLCLYIFLFFPFISFVYIYVFFLFFSFFIYIHIHIQ
ncbi:hypothetical protein GGS21DRAFT_543686, partial [Xylaria nigripes]